MDDGIFKKLKIKPDMKARVFFAPPEYPVNHGLEDTKGDAADFVHLFVASRAEFTDRFAAAADTVASDGLLWLSYPKSSSKAKFDINRDSLWDLALAAGWHPVAQVSLSDTWSAMRLKRNVPGQVYQKPGNTK